MGGDDGGGGEELHQNLELLKGDYHNLKLLKWLSDDALGFQRRITASKVKENIVLRGGGICR